MGILIQIIVGILGGIASALQGVFSGAMGQKVGDLTSVFFTYGIGAALVTVILLFNGGGNVSEWRSLPWYVFLSGPLGLVVIGSMSYNVPRLGATGATILFILAWLVCSVLIDQFGWFGMAERPLDWGRIVGLIALSLGSWLVLR